MLNVQTVDEIVTLLGKDEWLLNRVLAKVDDYTQELTITDLAHPEKKPRVVYNPRGPLRRLQRSLYQNLLLPKLIRNPHSFGGVAGKNTLACVQQHQKQRFFYSGDVRNFYPSIPFQRVQRLFMALGCSTEVARLLTRLTTHNYRLEQGFITSPIIADQIFRHADRRISDLCAKQALTYTRYVDDITISAPFNLAKSGIPKTISDILRDTSFLLREDKNVCGRITGGVLLGLRVKKGGIDVSSAYVTETIRRLWDLAELGANGKFVGPFFFPAGDQWAGSISLLGKPTSEKNAGKVISAIELEPNSATRRATRDCFRRLSFSHRTRLIG